MRRSIGITLVIAASAAYGAMPLLARIAYASGTEPFTLLFLRFAFASPLMLGVLALRRVAFPRGRQLLVLAVLGGVVYVVQALCYFVALTMAPASLVALLLYLYPVIVAAASSVMNKARFTAAKGIALALAVSGAALMIGFVAGGTVPGVLLAIAAALVYSVNVLAISRAMKSAPPVAASTVVIVSTALVYAGISVARGPVWPGTTAGWLAVAALAVVSTVIAIVAFYSGLVAIGPSDASTIATVEPAVAVILSALFLGESLTVARAIGAGLILAAVIIVARTPVRAVAAQQRARSTLLAAFRRISGTTRRARPPKSM